MIITFRVRLKKTKLRFDFEKMRDPDVASTFQATTGGKFAPLIELTDEDMDINTMIAWPANVG